VARVAEIDAAIEAWTAQRTVADVLAAMAAARVPAGKVYTAKDIHDDLHFRARGMIVAQVTRGGWSLDVPGVVPRLTGTPGTLRSPAPLLGEDTDAVLRELGLGDEAIAALRAKGVLG
jgi:formyl-CoA transferase